MVKIGKARMVTKEEAVKTLKKYSTPIIVSKVSGKYMEICRSSPRECVYWCAERAGLKCLRNDRTLKTVDYSGSKKECIEYIVKKRAMEKQKNR
ncbi:hypothetical protein [Archaeoglobus veneficus]|uniref:hypothetical protein n=1 Tax=Archaeoglobus veneficus TaxID=58290 RepID=UPI000AC7BCB8|nr:hypothetical protein [Archaeoglobus veneficus]